MKKNDLYLAELIRSQLEGRTPQPIPDEVDIDDLKKIAVKNHITYMVFSALLKAPNLPKESIEQLRNPVMRCLFKTMEQVQEIKAIEECFEKNGIINQPLKGACMKFIYPSPEMREMSDVDIWINEKSFELAKEKLKERGYSLERSVKHHDIYCKQPYMVLEAHRAIYDKTVDKKQAEYFSIFSRAVLRPGCKYTYDFNIDDFYIYMIAHMAKHFYVRGCGIRNLVDIYVYLNRFGNEMNREYLTKEFKKLHLDSFVIHCEKLVDVWMNEKNDEEFYDNLFDYMVSGGIYGKDENGIWHKFSEKMQEDKKISRFRLKMWYTFPPLSYMSEYYPWLEKMPVLLPIAWEIRAFRGIFLKKGKYKRKMIKSIQQDEIGKYRDIYQRMGLNFR